LFHHHAGVLPPMCVMTRVRKSKSPMFGRCR
jgi:hypothetical protein